MLRLLFVAFCACGLASCSVYRRVGDFEYYPFFRDTSRMYRATVVATDGTFFLNSLGIQNGKHDTFQVDVDKNGPLIASAELVVHSQSSTGEKTKTPHVLSISNDGHIAAKPGLVLLDAQMIEIKLRYASRRGLDDFPVFRNIIVTIHTYQGSRN